MKTTTTGHSVGVSMGARVASVVVGSALVLLGVAGYLFMQPGVINDTLNHGATMSSGLGIELFIGLFLIAYGALVVRNWRGW